jgi:hypothetical protein
MPLRRPPSLLLFALGHLVAMLLVVALLIPRHTRFPHYGQVMSRLADHIARGDLTEEALVRVFGPLSEKGTANHVPWYKWKGLVTEGYDVVEQAWIITFQQDNNGESKLYLQSQRELLFGWEWAKAMYYEQFNTRLFDLATQTRKTGMGYLIDYHER